MVLPLCLGSLAFAWPWAWVEPWLGVGFFWGGDHTVQKCCIPLAITYTETNSFNLQYLPGRINPLHSPTEGFFINCQVGHVSKFVVNEQCAEMMAGFPQNGASYRMTSERREILFCRLHWLASWLTDQHGGVCSCHCQRGIVYCVITLDV